MALREGEAESDEAVACSWITSTCRLCRSSGTTTGCIFRDTSIEDGSIKVTLDAGDLRPSAVHDGDDFYIVLPVCPADGLLHATWTATVQNRDGMIEGHLTIPVQEGPVDIGELLSNPPDSGADHEDDFEGG